MSNTLTNPNVIKVALAVVYTKTTAVTVSSSATLVSLFTTVFNKAKNIVITPPSGDVEQIPLIGETASAVGASQTFQNYIMDEKPWTLAKISGTILTDINEDNLLLMIAGAGTATVTASYHLYNFGGSDSAKKRVLGAMLVLFKHGTGLREVLLNQLYITKLGDIKGTSADGHVEQDFEGVCAAEFYYEHFKD